VRNSCIRCIRTGKVETKPKAKKVSKGDIELSKFLKEPPTHLAGDIEEYEKNLDNWVDFSRQSPE